MILHLCLSNRKSDAFETVGENILVQGKHQPGRRPGLDPSVRVGARSADSKGLSSEELRFLGDAYVPTPVQA